MKKIVYHSLTALALTLSMGSCNSDFMETSPTDKIDSEQATQTMDNLQTLLSGTHRSLYGYWGYDKPGESGMNMHKDILGDDVVMPSRGNGWFVNEYGWLRHIDPDSGLPYFGFEYYYSMISAANTILAYIDEVAGDDATRNQIKGEALVFRAHSHFQMVQLYGKRYVAGQDNSQPGVPYRVEANMEPQARNTVEEVYKMANEDIDQAIELLASYNRKSINHFSQCVAYGIKARMALVQENWPVAIEAATKALETARGEGLELQSGESLLEGFNNVERNREWMWGSIMTTEQDLSFTHFFSYMSWNFNSTPVRKSTRCIKDNLYAKISPTDIRVKWWDPTGEAEVPLSSYSKWKYQNRKFTSQSAGSAVNDIVYMRMSEMYLIKAEAEARSGKEDAARQTLLEWMVTRDPEYKLSTNSGQALIDEVWTNRRIELWGEGFSFTDLKRLNQNMDRRNTNHDEAVCTIMYVPAGDSRWQFKIPKSEMNVNPLMEQND